MTLSRSTATSTGFAAVLLWSSLAVLTAATGRIPPFQLSAMTFGIGGVAGLLLLLRRPGGLGTLRQPWPVWLLGVGGLFGYHAAYFFALRHAPPVQAGLINYLWPLLIVVFSAALPGEVLRWNHLAGVLVALVGAGLVVTGGRGLVLDPAYFPGYAAALFAAVCWAVYSVLSRRFASVPSTAITGFCLATAALSALCHVALKTTVWPAESGQWAAVAALGLGPVGLAFSAWDVGVKHGDIQVLGAASYLAPLLSTGILIAAGYAPFTPLLAVACVLITAGALLAASSLLFGRRGAVQS